MPRLDDPATQKKIKTKHNRRRASTYLDIWQRRIEKQKPPPVLPLPRQKKPEPFTFCQQPVDEIVKIRVL